MDDSEHVLFNIEQTILTLDYKLLFIKENCIWSKFWHYKIT